MRNRSLALLLVLPVLGSGCGFARNIRRNVVYSPLFAYTERASHHRHVQLGREAWRQMVAQYPDNGFSCDYRRGFVEGFADFLDFGGIGEPPPIPPETYRLFGYMTPDGLAAMEDWKVGFRHGSATSKASGLRELVTIPVYWGPVYASSPPPETGEPRPRMPVLPPPRKMELTPPAATPKPDPAPAKPPEGPAVPDQPPAGPQVPK